MTLFAVYSENFLYGTLNVVKSNAGCNEFESNKVAKLQNVSRAEEDKTRKVKKTKQNKTKKMVEADVEIATLNKQKTVVRVDQKQYNLQ